VGALVEAKLREYTVALETTITEQVNQQKASSQDEDYTLSAKQVEYAISLIEKVKEEFELAIEPSKVTIQDLNRLIAYNRYKNKGMLINLVKKDVLRKKSKFELKISYKFPVYQWIPGIFFLSKKDGKW
jgi:hypothetical protein